MNNSQFSVKWIDKEKQEREKIYDTYDEAQKAYRWLLSNGAEAPDIAVIKRLEPKSEALE